MTLLPLLLLAGSVSAAEPRGATLAPGGPGAVAGNDGDGPFLSAAAGAAVAPRGGASGERPRAEENGSATPRPGFLVLAPDRGFLGNEETREAFDAYAKDYDAALAIVGAEEPERALSAAVAALRERKATELVVLPLFAHGGHPMLRRGLELLADPRGPLPAELPARAAAPFGEHFLAGELLAERAAAASRDPAREFLLLVAHGEGAPVEAALERAAAAAARRLGFAGRGAAALPGLGIHESGGMPDPRAARERLARALEEPRRRGLRPVVVPFELSTKLDSHMAFPAYAAAMAGGGAGDLTPHPYVELWLRRRSNECLPVGPAELGVVYMPHGAGYAWNERMLETLGPLRERWRVEPAFTMGDPAVLERALRRLERRGARAITVLRVFTLADSFRASVEGALGLAAPADPAHAEHAGHGHGAHGRGSPPGPIATAAAVYTTGGIEDSPQLARALADRALALSREPGRETVFLVGHGDGDEGRDARWRALLGSLAGQVRALAEARGARFLGVETGTWREDWPERRAVAVADLRARVQAAARGGRAIVIPARTTGPGPERELLAGLDYAYDGLGFAPHPEYAAWVESRIRESLDHFARSRLAGLTPLRRALD